MKISNKNVRVELFTDIKYKNKTSLISNNTAP